MFAQTQAEYGKSGRSAGGKPVRALFIKLRHRKIITAALNRKRTRLSRHALYQSIMMILLHSGQEQLTQADGSGLDGCGSETVPTLDDRVGVPHRHECDLPAVGPDGSHILS